MFIKAANYAAPGLLMMRSVNARSLWFKVIVLLAALWAR